MGFYHTSANVKMLRNIIINYESKSEITPYEFIRDYVEHSSMKMEENKLTWIAETFLSIIKHKVFLKEVADYLSEELTQEEQDYFMITFHAVIFQVQPKDMEVFFKTLFNLSKPLLSTFTNFLSNNEMLTYISHVAQASYDTNYVSEKIICPLFTWQPYISEMAHMYASYIMKIESRKIKPLTVATAPAMLYRKTNRESTALPDIVTYAPPNATIPKNKRYLSKSAMDRRIQSAKEKNKQKATSLLNAVKNADYHYAQPKPDLANQKPLNTSEYNNLPYEKPRKFILKTTLPPIRENVALIKRYNKRKQQTEQEEIDWLQGLLVGAPDSSKYEELNESERIRKEKQRLYDIEKKHVLGLLSYEEAVLAKNKLKEQNKKKYEAFMKEKQAWCDELEKWKQTQMKKTHAIIEKQSVDELHAAALKNELIEKRKEDAAKIKRETEELLAEVMRVRKQELEEKIKMLKEIKVLSMIARKARVPKIVDLTETAGLGLLCEMSIAELQERIVAMKIGIKEELERKKALVKKNNDVAKKELGEIKESVFKFISEREEMRKLNIAQKHKIKDSIKLNSISTKEIDDLKNILEQKRIQRLNKK